MRKVKQMLREERIEKEMKIAEIENDKAINLIRHAEEIYNKPKKTWIKIEKDV